MTHWVDEFLVPLNACFPAKVKARKYPDPQSAWDAWDRNEDLFWTLWKANADRPEKLQTILLCVCDMAEKVLPIFETQYPSDQRPREAIEAAIRCIKEPSSENKKAADDVANIVIKSLHCYKDTAWNIVATAYQVADASSCDDDIVFFYRLGKIADNVELVTGETDIVRKYFPVSPFVQKEENQ